MKVLEQLARTEQVDCGYRNSSDRMGILRCAGPGQFFLERVVFPFELLTFHCPERSEVEIWTHGLGGPELPEAIEAHELLMESSPVPEPAAGGIESTEILVSYDGLAVVANPENDWASCLTTDQLAKIWGPGSKVNSWQDVDASFPDVAMKLYGPGTDSGTFDYFTDEINGEEGASRTDYSPSEDDNVTIQGVSGEKGGLGYFGLSYYEENKDKLKLMEIDSGAGCVAPSVTTVQDGTYTPLSRPLYMYVSGTAAERPEVKAFAQFIADNQDALNTEALFVPLSADQVATLKTGVASITG